MPTYIYEKEAFLRFIERHLRDKTVVIVSSDVMDLKLERLESYVGVKDYFVAEFGVAADIMRDRDVDRFDEKPKYVVVFVDEDELTEEAVRNIRKGLG